MEFGFNLKWPSNEFSVNAFANVAALALLQRDDSVGIVILAYFKPTHRDLYGGL